MEIPVELSDRIQSGISRPRDRQTHARCGSLASLAAIATGAWRCSATNCAAASPRRAPDARLAPPAPPANDASPASVSSLRRRRRAGDLAPTNRVSPLGARRSRDAPPPLSGRAAGPETRSLAHFAANFPVIPTTGPLIDKTTRCARMYRKHRHSWT